MTQAELQQRVKDRLDETDSTSQRYPDSVTSGYLLDGVRHYVTKTRNQMETSTITQAANTLFYDLPCDCIRVMRVSWSDSGTLYPLEATSSRLLDETTYQWQRSLDTRARCYFIFGLDKIALWPVSATAGKTYTVHYEKDAFTDITLVPENDHGLLINYAMARYFLAEGKAQEATDELGIYMKGVGAAVKRIPNTDKTWAMGPIGD